MTPLLLGSMLEYGSIQGVFHVEKSGSINNKDIHDMINYVRERVIQIIKNTKTAIIATTGPSGLQISEFLCEAIELVIYLLIPKTSDHLLNLEQDGQLALHTDQWELTGKGEILPEERRWPEISLISPDSSRWYVLVKVMPNQIQVLRPGEWGPTETIDLSSFF